MNTRPNVLIAVFDSLGEDRLNALIDSLPTLRALQSKSVVFANTYVSSPESSPARASLFTGLDIASHRVWSDGVALPKREKTLSECFASSGYHTWLFGRRQLAGISNWTTEHARLREYHCIDWAHGPLHRSRQNAYLVWLQKNSADIYNRLFPTYPNPDDTRIPDWQRQALADLPDELSFNTWLGQQFCQRLKEHRNHSPFMAVAGFVVGETLGAPLTNTLCVEALNGRALRQADTALATMIGDLPENTIVVVTAGRGNVVENNVQRCMHNEAIKVPLMIKLPECEASIVEGAVSTMDIAPTLFNATQTTMPKRVQGRCLFTSPPRNWAMSRLRSPTLPHQSALCTHELKLVMTHTNVSSNDSLKYQLFDLTADSAEVTDLASADAYHDKLEAMIDLMIDARVALEDRTEPRVAKF